MERDGPDAPRLTLTVEMLEFLYKSYKPSAWYFELIETFRKLFLTAVISVMSAGTSAQATVALVASFGFIEFYSAVGT